MAKSKTNKKPPNFFTWLRSGLRSMSRRYAPIYEAMAAAKEPYKGDNPRQRYCYRCALCGGTFAAKEVACDHRVDCGTLTSWDDVQGFMQRLFCGKEGLDILCHTCHDAKTYAVKHNVTMEEAKQAKEVIRICKEIKKDDLLKELYKRGYSVSECSNADKRKTCVEKELKKGSLFLLGMK